MAGRPKTLTREQLIARKGKAARFVRDVLGDPERADEITGESLDDYAARRRIQITNPKRRDVTMPRKTVEDYRADIAGLKDQIADLEEENEGLQEQLDDISEILAPEEEEGDEAGDGDDSGD